MLVSTTGDLGDAVFLLNILKNLPNGPHSLGLRPSTTTKAKTPEQAQRMFDLLKPLVDSQSYISEFRLIDPSTTVDWRSEDFRSLRHYTPGETLMQAHLNHYCVVKQTAIKIDGSTAWLKADPSPVSKGRVVINRTGRYRNSTFPWYKVVDHYKHHLMFIGLEHEWREFCGNYGYVDFQPTENMLQVAELIAGSALFIGNQSSAGAIAEGLKHPRIQETSLVFPDCIFPQAPGLPEVQHVAKGDVHLPAIGLRPAVTIPSSEPTFREMDISRVPPGRWQYPGEKPSNTFNGLALTIARRDGVSREQARQMVYEFQCARLPDFFAAEDHHLIRFKIAKQKAG
jgi:hypothetical protein